MNSFLEEQFTLSGEVAVVVGGTGELCGSVAKEFKRAGAKVVLAAPRADKPEEQVANIVSQGGEALAVSLDVTSAESVQTALDNAEAAFGPITVLINNAGVADSKRFVNIDEDSWDFVMNTNLKGVWRLASAVSKRLLTKELSGSIVNISSILGLRVGFGESSYAVSKAAVVQMTKAMALELGYKGIRVNALCPGYFKTEINAEYFESEKGQAYLKNTPAKRLGHIDELNMPLLMLASDAGSFINGIALPVDGGHLVGSL